MQKFTEFLTANRGMSSLIAKTLGIKPTNITNAKTGRLLMPTAWMATIVKLSKRKLSYQTLVEEREVHRADKARSRSSANKNTANASI